ncbi:hypothetical protein [Sutcliffiella horikoshii]|uniref:Uncharacterized protein n=1 Tax=Sutcliffiella horikoshii TaxID=79883 RepID=A0A5D4T689_9BACI|nr:hypothetical protein [Sutcliffiella horikoshii]TYS69992.1 hypothetical protein FZC75_15230 [Sutcliffiella horikoshii]
MPNLTQETVQTVRKINSPSLYKFVFVFYQDAQARIPAGYPKQSDYQPTHHTRHDDIDYIIQKYSLPDWKEYKLKAGKNSWLEKWGNDMKREMKKIMQTEGLVITRKIEGSEILVKYIWGK